MENTWKVSITITRSDENAPTLRKEFLFHRIVIKALALLKRILSVTAAMLRMLFTSGNQPQLHANAMPVNLHPSCGYQRIDR